MEITLLTQDGCSFCDQAKALLAKLGSEFALSVTEIDLSSPTGQELGMRFGVLFAPGILVEGEPVSYGRPSERRLRRELARRVTA